MLLLTQKINERGVDYLNDAELLAVVGQFTLTTARTLLAESGGLAHLQHYTTGELQAHRGVGPSKAAAVV